MGADAEGRLTLNMIVFVSEGDAWCQSLKRDDADARAGRLLPFGKSLPSLFQ